MRRLRGNRPREYRCVARDGRVVWVRDEAIIMVDNEGRPRFRQGILLDITEHTEICSVDDPMAS